MCIRVRGCNQANDINRQFCQIGLFSFLRDPQFQNPQVGLPENSGCPPIMSQATSYPGNSAPGHVVSRVMLFVSEDVI